MAKTKFKEYKKQITIKTTKDREGKLWIHFYLVIPHITSGEYLFTIRYSKGVYVYFKNGRSESELYEYARLGHNPRLTHQIDRLRNCWIGYAMSEIFYDEPERTEKKNQRRPKTERRWQLTDRNYADYFFEDTSYDTSRTDDFETDYEDIPDRSYEKEIDIVYALSA